MVAEANNKTFLLLRSRQSVFRGNYTNLLSILACNNSCCGEEANNDLLFLSAARGLVSAGLSNNFFGGEVTVTGLLTGTDLAEQLAGKKLGETLYLSRTTLRAEGDLFLCGMSPEELSEKLGVTIEFIENDGSEFCLKLLGLE